MSSREMILERLASAAWPEKSKVRAPISCTGQLEADIQKFISQASAAGAVVEEVQDIDQVQTRLAELAAAGQMKKITVSSDETTDLIDWELLSGQTGCEVRNSKEMNGSDYRNYVLEADLGVTGCKYGLAETGTVVLEHSHANERLVSHAPNHYICIVKKAQILAHRSVAGANTGWQSAASGCRTLVTGVSRTADVALQVVPVCMVRVR
jgi:L-lactate utilization protein LutC